MDGFRKRWTDALLAWAAGLAVWSLAWFSGNGSEIPPELWEQTAVAAGIRPPVAEFPILWQHILSFFIGRFGIASCLAFLQALGPISLGLLTVMACGIFSGCLPEVMCRDMRGFSGGRWTSRLIVLQGALLLSCSQPVWLAGRILSPVMLNLLLTAAALLAMRVTFSRASVAGMIFTGAISGVLAAETPLAFLLPALCIFLLRRRCVDPASDAPGAIVNPIVHTAGVRWMVSVFIFCWLGMVIFNLSFYRSFGAMGVDGGIFISTIRYLVNYLKIAGSSTTIMGALLVVSMVVLPMVIVSALLRRLCDAGRMAPLPYLCFVALSGVIALLQLSDFAGCRLWDWEPETVKSGFLLCVSMFAAALTVVHALSIFAVDVFFRNHARLLREMYPDAVDDEPLALTVIRVMRRIGVTLRRPLRFEPLLAVAVAVPFKFADPVGEMSSIVNDIAGKTASECRGDRIIFTDGAYDAAVEVASAVDGGNLKAVSMMSGSGEYQTALRVRGEDSEENRALLEAGAAEALRTWVREGRNEATNIAVQVGLELWHHCARPYPGIGGFAARTAGYPGGEAERCAAAARSTAERMIRFCERHEIEKCAYPELRRLFCFGLWRLSRMCRLRAYAADGRGEKELAEREMNLADGLERSNPEWRKVRERMSWTDHQKGLRLSAREGLKLALDRADFRLAKPFAENVLSVDDGDVEANFAMAMFHFKSKNYSAAEKHLKKYLVRRPDEPAVLNNLAVVQLRLGRLDEAETNAVKALERFAGSPEIKSTLRSIREAKKGEKQ
jgi:tetratricopeptide (TPR) repeat protein